MRNRVTDGLHYAEKERRRREREDGLTPDRQTVRLREQREQTVPSARAVVETRAAASTSPIVSNRRAKSTKP